MDSTTTETPGRWSWSNKSLHGKIEFQDGEWRLNYYTDDAAEAKRILDAMIECGTTLAILLLMSAQEIEQTCAPRSILVVCRCPEGRKLEFAEMVEQKAGIVKGRADG